MSLIRSGLLSLGAIGALGSVAFAATLVEGYVRHLSSGDQAGAWLGLMFLLMWFLPGATTPMLMAVGARALDPRDGIPEPWRGPRWVSLPLLASGVLLALFSALYVMTQVVAPRGAGRSSLGLIGLLGLASYAGSLLGFACIWTMLGWNALGRSAWAFPKRLPAVLLITVLAMAAVNGSMLVSAFRSAYSGMDRWALLIRNLLFFSMPTIVWTLVLLWCVWSLSRSPSPAPRAS